MDHAVKIDQESRQSEVMRNRRNNSSELIDTTANEISDIDINYVTSRQGDSRFNSTMKPGYQREGKDFSARSQRSVAEIAKIDMETDLHIILTSASNFIKSPVEVEAHRKVDLEDKKIKEETRQEFNKLCD